MKLSVRKRTAKEVGFDAFLCVGLEEDDWSWRETLTIDIFDHPDKDLKELVRILKGHPKAYGVKALLWDIDRWEEAKKGNTTMKPKNMLMAFGFMLEYCREIPNHRIFKLHGGEQHLCYYLSEVEYRPEEKHNYDTTPQRVIITLVSRKYGQIDRKTVTFLFADFRGRTIPQALQDKGYVKETPALRTQYKKTQKHFMSVREEIGVQYLAEGMAIDDMDGNPDSNFFSRRNNTLDMAPFGSPSKVITDIFAEGGDRKKHDDHFDRWFWSKRDEDDEPDIYIPTHPFTAIYHLAKHLRMSIHTDFLTKYVFDTGISSKLIIPKETSHLIGLLVEHQDGGFEDIIQGKSGGAVVLLSGRPGTGKTLTAEIYSEATEKALYSVQCSQLGTDPTELEDNLTKIFMRASRWDAVLLLDEADVYIQERGDNLEANAVVGVFLRVLEYQQSILFMTTNRPDSVDDAIASRCIARVRYEMPDTKDQKKIWKVLAGTSGAKLTAGNIVKIVKENPNLSGRDIKNYLKLAMLMKGNTITPESIRFVRRFRPVGTEEGE